MCQQCGRKIIDFDHSPTRPNKTVKRSYLLGHCRAATFCLYFSVPDWLRRERVSLRNEEKMKNVSLPGFTAEGSLRASRGRYRAQMAGGSGEFDSVQPQTLQVMRKGQCWCDEPDTRIVCQGGNCHEIPVCLQWSCPGAGIDDIPGSTTVYTPAGPSN